MSEDNPGGLAELAEYIAKNLPRPHFKMLPPSAASGEIPMVAVPAGWNLVDAKPMLAAFLPRPERREGKTVLTSLNSFIDWTLRHKGASSVVYAVDDINQPSLCAVIDHDEAGDAVDAPRARFGRHRGTFAFPFSREWLEWMAVAGPKAGPMKPTEFADFLERRIGDVLAPETSLKSDGTIEPINQSREVEKLVGTLGKKLASPSDLVALGRGITINSDLAAKVEHNRDTGESTVLFSEINGVGADRLKPPNLFLIGIPVLNCGDVYEVAVHLRYRATSGIIAWTLQLHQPERVFEKVFSDALGNVEIDTDLPVLRGIAPVAR